MEKPSVLSEVSADGSCSQTEIPGLWRSHLCDRSVTSYSWAWGLVASEHTQPLSAARGSQTETENKLLTHHSPPALCQSLPAPFMAVSVTDSFQALLLTWVRVTFSEGSELILTRLDVFTRCL